MTWPERLDLILAILAQVPYDWIFVGIVVGMALSAVLDVLAILIVAGDDPRRRDVYCEDHVDEEQSAW